MVKKRRKLKNKKAGFTLVELIVAVTVLSIASVPIMSCLVMTSRLNLKGRRQEQALTVAQNLVEGVKAFGISELVKQCDETYTSDFTIIPENSSSVKISHKITLKSEQTYTVDIAGYELMNGTLIGDTDGDGAINGDEKAEVEFEATTYEFEIYNILMGSTYYDAVVSVVPSTEDKDLEYLVSYYYKDSFEEAGMSNLKYYDVEVNVSLHDDTGVLATYTGSLLDQD